MELETVTGLLGIVRDSSWVDLIIAFFIMTTWTQLHTIPRAIRKFITEYKRSSVSHFNMMFMVNETILARLTHALDDMSCSRIVVVQYHNGDHAMNGSSFNKMTCTHEVICRRSRLSEKQSQQVQPKFIGVPVTVYSSITALAHNNEVMSVGDVQSSHLLGPSIKNQLRDNGTKSIIISSLRDERDHPVGLIVFEFLKKYASAKEDNLKYALNCTRKISTLLETAGKYRENLEPTTR